MHHLLSWLFIASLLALWSLAIWALHAITAWATMNAGALTTGSSGSGAVFLTDWLPRWLPTEVAQAMTQAAAGFRPLADSLLQAVPALSSGLTVVTWVVWATGGVFLLMLGAAMSLLIAQWRRRSNDATSPNARRLLATR